MTEPPSADEAAPAPPARPTAAPPATGEQWVIGHGYQQAVVTEVGATLRSYTAHDRPVVDGFGPEQWSPAGRGQVLAPWPNRLGDGRYTFQGTEGVAPLDEPDRHNAIHGLVRWLPWRMASRAQNRVCLTCELFPTPAYPFHLRLSVEYRLGREGLTVLSEAENVGADALPFGIGFHPYVTVGTASVDQVRLTVPADRRLVTDDRGLPTARIAVEGTEFDFRQGRILGVTRLDTAFTGLHRDGDGRTCVDVDHPDGIAGVTLWVDGRFGYLMVFTGDTLAPPARRRSVAVEPMSCPPDALRSGEDLVVLHPGARWAGSWGVTAR